VVMCRAMQSTFRAKISSNRRQESQTNALSCVFFVMEGRVQIQKCERHGYSGDCVIEPRRTKE
jgi:hypothetical protein